LKRFINLQESSGGKGNFFNVWARFPFRQPATANGLPVPFEQQMTSLRMGTCGSSTMLCSQEIGILEVTNSESNAGFPPTVSWLPQQVQSPIINLSCSPIKFVTLWPSETLPYQQDTVVSPQLIRSPANLHNHDIEKTKEDQMQPKHKRSRRVGREEVVTANSIISGERRLIEDYGKPGDFPHSEKVETSSHMVFVAFMCCIMKNGNSKSPIIQFKPIHCPTCVPASK
jgi:hypothetical protein